MATVVHPSDVNERGRPMRDPGVEPAALKDRRTVHSFQDEPRPDGNGHAPDVCVVCGYAEAGHSRLTQPEQDVMVGLLNQRQAPALMRRSILHKLMPARFRAKGDQESHLT